MGKPWTTYYKVVGIKPGKVVIPGTGEVDLSDEKLSLDMVRRIHNKGCHFLELTEEGKKMFSPEMNMNAKEVAAVMQEATTKEQAKALLDLKPESVLVQRAYENKIHELSDSE